MIILVRPMTPDTSRSGLVSIQYPINIGYLVSYMKKNNIPCEVIDYEVESFSEEAFLKSVKKSKPNIIGLSCMTPHVIHGAMLARLVKKHFPEILTVIGGVHATAIPEQTLVEFPQFDVVVLGEGEETLLELYKAWTSSKNIRDVRSIAFMDNGTARVNPKRPLVRNLDELPFPDRRMVDIKYYRKSHVSRGFSRNVINIAEVMVSRGCPYDCIFCASKIVHTRGVRFRSPENIIKEIQDLMHEHHVEHISFLDDTFTIRKEILKPVCEYIKSQKVTFDCYTRVSDIDEEKMSIMVSAGCRKVSFGIESGSPKVLKLIKKGITLDHINRAISIAKKSGLPLIETTFMIGCHPDETLEDIEMTRKLIYRLRPDILGIFISIPYPGTELNKILKDRGLLINERWEEFSLFFGEPSWETGQVPVKILKKILRKTTRYYLHPTYILLLLRKIKSYKEFKYYLNTGFSFLKLRFNLYSRASSSS